MPDVTMPDGTIVNFPDDMPKEEIRGMIASKFPEVSTKEPLYGGGAVSDLRAGLSGAADMATLGFSDEMKAGLQGLVRGGLDPNLTIGEAYQHFLDKARSEGAQLQEENPYAYGGGQFMGGMAMGAGAAPKAITQAMTKGVLPKYAAGTGLGALSGGVYAAGTGEGGIRERAENIPSGVALGAVGGATGTALGSLAGRALKVFGKKVKTPAPQDVQLRKLTEEAPDLLAPATPAQARQLALGKQTDEVFSKSVGQRTQMPQAQRIEAQALGGVLGEKPERIAKQALTQQSRERKAFLGQLGDIERVGDANDILDDVFDTIKSQAGTLKKEVNNAYDLAREGGGTKINADDIKDGLFSKVMQTKRTNQYDIDAMPSAKSRMKELTRLVRSSKGGRVKEANLSAMENWRKRVTNAIESTQDKTEKRFLRNMLNDYDDFMYDTANNAVDQGDQDAILAFREAVRKRRNYGKLYESDKFVSDLVAGKKDIDDAVKDLIGTGSLVGKKRMTSTYEAILKAAGDEAPIVRGDLQAAFAKKILDQSIEGLEEGGQNAYLSAAKTQKALTGLFKNNRNFARKLYGEEAYSAALKAIDELEVISKTQPSTQNPSGTAQMVLNVMNRTPLLNILGKSMEMSGEAMKSKSVGKSFSEIVQEIKVKPKSSLFSKGGAITGGALAADQEK